MYNTSNISCKTDPIYAIDTKLRKLKVNYVNTYGELHKLMVNYDTRYSKLCKQVMQMPQNSRREFR